MEYSYQEILFMGLVLLLDRVVEVGCGGYFFYFDWYLDFFGCDYFCYGL